MKIHENIKITKKGFEESFSEENYYNKQTRDDKHLELLLNLLKSKPKDTILDLGTGTGYIAFPLAENNKDVNVIGLDIVTEILEENKKKAIEKGIHNLKFISYDGEKFPFQDESIDIIISRYALHHFPDIQISFAEMYRILKPNGKLIISDPSPNDNDKYGFVDKYMQMKQDGHIKFYSLCEYKKMLNELNFKFLSNEITTIRFPRKEAEKYEGILLEEDDSVISGYDIELVNDEIWITEQVLNMTFIKE